jgi:hypothetical protein
MSALIALPSNLERRVLLSSGEILGAVRDLPGEKSNCLRIELLNYITFTGSRARPRPGKFKTLWRRARSAEPESGGIHGNGC